MKIETVEFGPDGLPVGETVTKEKKPRPKPVPPKGPGRPAVVQYSEWKQMSKKELMPAMAEMLTRPMGEVTRIAKDPNSTGARALMAAVLNRGVYEGSTTAAMFFMSYTFGKPIEHDPKEDQYDPTIKGSKVAESLPSFYLEEIIRKAASDRDLLAKEQSEGTS